MRGQMPVALFAITFGAAVDTAGGLQEVVYLGILRSETEPLVMGTLGTVASVLLLAAGIALLIRVETERRSRSSGFVCGCPRRSS